MTPKLVVLNMDENGSSLNPHDEPGLEGYIRLLASQRKPPKLAIVSRQSSVGLRAWVETFKDGTVSPNWLTREQAEEKVFGWADMIVEWGLKDVAVFLSFRHKSQAGNWSTPPEGEEGSPEWSIARAELGNGAVVQEAIEWAKVKPKETLYLSDTEEEVDGGFSFVNDVASFFRPYRHEVHVHYNPLMLYSKLSEAEKLGLDLISTIARFEILVAQALDHQSLGEVVFERFRDEDGSTTMWYIESETNQDFACKLMKYFLNNYPQWLVYDSAETHVLRQAVHSPQLLEKIYNISHKRASKLVYGRRLT